MSVKICNKEGKIKDFCSTESIESQIENASHVHLEVGLDNGKKAVEFLEKLRKASKYTSIPPIDIRVEMGNTINGARIARSAKSLKKSLALYWIIRELTSFQRRLDIRLANIISQMKHEKET
jgi:predicted nucleotidyltransferase